MSKHLPHRLLGGILALGVALLGAGSARAQVVYFHNDSNGSPALATDANGTLIWKQSYRPYGDPLQLEPVSSGNNTLWFTGKPFDPDTDLSYFGARYYDPSIGRFLAIDPKEADPNSIYSLNRYAYGNSNPYRYTDPDGRLPILIIPALIWAGKALTVASAGITAYEATSVVYGVAAGDMTTAEAIRQEAPGLAIGAVTGVAGRVATRIAKRTDVETVQRWMSEKELQSTRDTGLLRGGREGTHWVTDAANADPLRARQRLALDRTPEVRVTLEVPRGTLSPPSPVERKFGMPGGGRERTATGDVPVRIIRVDR